MKSAAKGYFDSGVILHDICNHEIQDIGHTSSDMMYWILSFIQSINQMTKIHAVKKSNEQGQSNQLLNQFKSINKDYGSD